MKCVLLAAGYATRLYPLTRDFPKPLLEVGGMSILEHIVQKIERAREIDELVLVTNARFHAHFEAYAAGRAERGTAPLKVSIIDDGSTDNDNRLGALADLELAIERARLEGDTMVLAADNLFDFELSDFLRFFHEKGADCVTAHELHDLGALRRTGVIELDAEGRAVGFEEKPREPRSRLAVPPFYFYKAETLPLLREYLRQGGNPDAPGNFVPWLIARKSVYAFRFEGRRYDIGSHESLAEARAIFGAKDAEGAGPRT
jgi:glucose-1-phosphate thymidylyltransferase